MTSVLLVGCGRMGKALLAGWLGTGVVDRVFVIEPHGIRVLSDDPRVVLVADRESLPQGFTPDAVVFAVKPQVLESVAVAYRDIVVAGVLAVSIAAGKTLARLASYCGDGAAIVRSMPNLPATIGSGVTVCIANRHVSPDQRSLCQCLLGAVGALEWVEDESLLDAVTAVSGSGPAYIFLMIEALSAAGEAAGMPADLAMRLARATVCGAGELARQSPESAEILRQSVATPGGTAAAALAVLMAKPGLQDLLDRAVDAATRRSRELAS